MSEKLFLNDKKTGSEKMDILTELYMRYREGDERAFDELVLSVKDGLIYYVNRYVKDIHTAEDISEDVFVSLLMHPKRFSGDSSVKTYLYTIGRNKAIDRLRRNRRTQVDEEAGLNLPDDILTEDEMVVELCRLKSGT